jgi:hypothetical protein
MCTGGSCLAQRFGRESPHTSGLNVTRDHILGQPERDWRRVHNCAQRYVVSRPFFNLSSPMRSVLGSPGAAKREERWRGAGNENCTGVGPNCGPTLGL